MHLLVRLGACLLEAPPEDAPRGLTAWIFIIGHGEGGFDGASYLRATSRAASGYVAVRCLRYLHRRCCVRRQLVELIVQCDWRYISEYREWLRRPSLDGLQATGESGSFLLVDAIDGFRHRPAAAGGARKGSLEGQHWTLGEPRPRSAAPR